MNRKRAAEKVNRGLARWMDEHTVLFIEADRSVTREASAPTSRPTNTPTLDIIPAPPADSSFWDGRGLIRFHADQESCPDRPDLSAWIASRTRPLSWTPANA